MKICPRCAREYEDALENCLVCGSLLQEHNPTIAEEDWDVLGVEPQVTEQMLEEIDPENLPEVICSVVGEEEARRLAALMQEYRIPCLCKENGEEDEVYDLYIPKKKFNKAIEILNEDEAALAEEESLLADEFEETLEQEEETFKEVEQTEEEQAPKKKRWFDFFR